MFSALLSALFSALFFFFFCFYSLADSGERRKPRRTGPSGVRGGQDKGFVLKLSWPSTAHAMYEEIKKKKKMAEPGRIQNDEIKKIKKSSQEK